MAASKGVKRAEQTETTMEAALVLNMVVVMAASMAMMWAAWKVE